MKAIVCVITISLLSAFHLWAQQPSIIRIKGGPNWQRSVPFRDRYRFAEFRTGTITYTRGLVANGRFNYNVLLGEMQFIDPKGDTLSLANETRIQAIRVGESEFRYAGKIGFLEILVDYGPITLAFKPIFRTVRAEKNGAYHQSSGTSAITQYKSFIGSSGQLSRLEQEGDLLLEKDVFYGMIDQNNRIHKMNRSTILKVFPKYKSAIEAYLKNELIDFKKEADLRKLLQFCSTLS